MHHDALDEHRGDVAGVLKRQDANGTDHISEAEIGREVGLDATRVGSLLHRMQADGEVTRTADGNWELTAAAALRTEPRPHPREPRQD
jgi:hypothetical protein